MGDIGEYWRDVSPYLKQKAKERRDNNLKNAIINDDGKWTKHTTYHWSRFLNGKRLDYWASRNKFQYEGRIHTGDVLKFINKRERLNHAHNSH